MSSPTGGKVIGKGSAHGHSRRDSTAFLAPEPGSPRNPSTRSSPQAPGHIKRYSETEQDLADLTAEMALLEDDSRGSRYSHRSTLSSGSGVGGLRPLSLASQPYDYRSSPKIKSSAKDGYDSSGDEESTKSGPPAYSASKSPQGLRKIPASTFFSPSGDDIDYPQYRRNWVLIFDTLIYRTRFALRLISLIFSGCVMGALAHLTDVYLRTRFQKDRTGNLIWPPENAEDELELRPSNVLLAGSVVCAAMGLAWCLSSISDLVRLLTTGRITLLALFGTMSSWTIWVAGIIYLGGNSSSAKARETLFLVCKLSEMKWDLEEFRMIDFAFHCGEIKFGWYAAIGVATTDFLIVLTIIGGWVLRWWHNGGRIKVGASAWSAPPTEGLSRRGRSGAKSG